MNRSLKEKSHSRAKEINLKAIYAVLRRRIWIILLFTIIITTAASIYNSRPEPSLFVSSTRVIIVASNDMMNTVRVMVREPIVLNKVIDEMQLPLTASQLRGQIRVDNVESSFVTVISVMDADPDRAAQIANTTVQIYRDVASETLNVNGIRVLSPAEPDFNPVNVSSNRIVYAAFLVGLALGIGLALLLDSLDDTLRTEEEIEDLLDIAVLGQISKMNRIKATIHSKKHKTAALRGETIGS